MIRPFSAVRLVVLFLVTVAWTNPITSCHESPRNASRTIQHDNTIDPVSQMNIFAGRGIANNLAARQASCPDPSTNSLCPSKFCFIYQRNGDGTAWATCCPVGWSLSLNRADWSTQKCIINGVSEPPARPLNCGGSINGGTGIFSGWACVYSNRNVNGAGTAQWSILLVTSLTLSWFGMWLS